MPQQLPPPDLPPIGYNPPPQATYPFLNQIWYGTESGWGGGGGSPSPTPSPTPYPTYTPYSSNIAANPWATPPPPGTISQVPGIWENYGGAYSEPGALPGTAGYGADQSGTGFASQNMNYAPAPDGGTYVYDENWQYQGYVPPSGEQTAAATSAPPPASNNTSQWGGLGQPAGYFGVAPMNQYGSYGVGGGGGSFYGGTPGYTPMGYQGSDLAGIFSGPLPGAFGYYGLGYGGTTGPISVGLGGIPTGQGPSANAAYPNKGDTSDVGGHGGSIAGHSSIQ